MKGCGKDFVGTIIHKDGTKDFFVCACGGEDGLCEECEVEE